MFRFVLASVCLILVAEWSCAGSPTPDDLDAVPGLLVTNRSISSNPDDLTATAEIQVKARKLVRQLGSEDYTERENAQTQLTKLGRFARPALIAGVKANSNAEVRLRCSQLLPHATALDIRARLDVFLADVNGQYAHDFPAWNTFRETVCREWSIFGNVVWSDREFDRAARQVFAKLVATPDNRRLLMAIPGSRLVLSEMVVARRQELEGDRRLRDWELPAREPTLEDMTTLLFAESLVGSQYTPRRRGTPISSLLSTSDFRSAVRETNDKGRVYRAIAIAWLNSRNEPREMYQAMSIANSLDLTDQVCELSVRLLTMPGVMASYRGRAASQLVNNGSKKHIPLLDKATSNAIVIYTIRTGVADGNFEETTYEIQLRDLALTVSILLAGQKPEEYGLTDRYHSDSTDVFRSFIYNRYYFADEAARKKAFAKWTEWRKTHPTE